MRIKSILSVAVVVLWAMSIWAQDLSPAAVKQAYAKIAAMSPIDRRSALSKLDGRLQAKLWILHYSLFEANHSLDNEQRILVADLKQMMEGKDCVKDRNDIEYQLPDLRKRAFALFGVNATFDLIFRIGNQKLSSQ